ncbi:MAG TPA: hypothetical protein VN781_10295 [Acidimicrobiales bacterium]|nr:hypothetical protein [Acidimicrobiales bacterium]
MRLRSVAVLAGTAAACGIVLAAPAAWAAKANANALVSKAVSASALARTVTVTGKATQGKETITLSVQASASAAGQGSIGINGAVVHAIRLGPNVYFNANQKFWKLNGGAAAAALFVGKWVETAATTNDGQSLAQFLSVNTLFRQLFSGNINTATFTKGRNTTINGVAVTAVNGKDPSGGTNGTIYIARSGVPYVVELKSVGGTGGTSTVFFSAYNQPVHPVAPKNPVDIDQLKPATSG